MGWKLTVNSPSAIARARSPPRARVPRSAVSRAGAKTEIGWPSRLAGAGVADRHLELDVDPAVLQRREIHRADEHVAGRRAQLDLGYVAVAPQRHDEHR